MKILLLRYHEGRLEVGPDYIRGEGEGATIAKAR